ATRANPESIRSNAASVCVYPPGSGDCGTEKAPASQPTPTPQPIPTPQPTPAAKDTTPPVVHITSLRAGEMFDKGPRLLTGDVDEAGGIAQVFLRLRYTGGGGITGAKALCHWFSGKRQVF